MKLTDPRNILILYTQIIYTDIDKHINYNLGNENGTLAQLYAGNEFTVCPKPIINIENVPDGSKPSREIESL